MKRSNRCPFMLLAFQKITLILQKDVEKAKEEEKRVSRDTGGANADTEMAQLELEYVEEQHQN